MNSVANSVIAYYDKTLDKYGDSEAGIDWPHGDVSLRYQVMLDLMRPPCDLCDVGCGTGGLWQFIQSNKLDITYSGIDVNSKAISYCHAKGVPATLCEATEMVGTYDYVVANGVFGLKYDRSFEEYWSYCKLVLAKMFSCCRVALAANFMSLLVDWQKEHLFHMPMDMLTEFIAKELTRHFVIRHDYGLYEYTIYAFRSKYEMGKTRFSF